jgi:hypothetical protein
MTVDVGASGREAVASPSRFPGTRLVGDAVISPELALVDPDLAARGQAALPDGEDTLELLLDAARARGASSGEAPRRRRLSRKRVLQAGFAAAAVAGIAIALAFDVRLELRERDAAADSAIGPPAETLTPRPGQGQGRGAPSQGAATKTGAPASKAPARASKAAGSSPKASGRAKAASGSRASRSAGAARKRAAPEPVVQTRRFAWAPVPRATSYHVEFFRGSTRVFSASTTRAEIAIPKRWRFRGRAQSLEPGDYRWYVWPVFRGSGRAAAASVQARLRVG